MVGKERRKVHKLRKVHPPDVHYEYLSKYEGIRE